jgi:hypothetical protein
VPHLTQLQIADDPNRHGHYGGKRKDGQLCGKAIIPGTKTCTAHSGKPRARARAEGQVVLEARRRGWGLDTTDVDPGEYLLRLVAQSAHRVEMYADLLHQAFDAAERLRTAHEAEQLVVPPHPAKLAAVEDLRRIFTTGGVAALIGNQYDATKDGDLYATGEAIRGLAQLELQERRFGMELSAKAIAAGLAERMVRLAERQGALMAQFVLRVAERLGLTDVQQAALPGAIEAEVINMTEGKAA